MWAELLAPFAKWGTLLVGAGGLLWYLQRQIRKSSERMAELDEVKDALNKKKISERARARARRRDMRDRIDGL